MPSRMLWKGKVGKELLQSRYYRHRLFRWKRPFLSIQFHPGGNSACIPEKASHIGDCPFKIGAIFPTVARTARISSASACPGAKRRADGDRTGDAPGVRRVHGSRLGRMQPQAQRVSQWHLHPRSGHFYRSAGGDLLAVNHFSTHWLIRATALACSRSCNC